MFAKRIGVEISRASVVTYVAGAVILGVLFFDMVAGSWLVGAALMTVAVIWRFWPLVMLFATSAMVLVYDFNSFAALALALPVLLMSKVRW